MVSFVVPGPPRPLQRARVGRMGAHARMYDPDANTTNKATVGFYAKQAMQMFAKAGNGKLLIGPLTLEVTFYLPKPKSKVRKNSNPFPYPDSGVDLDNLVKLVCDSMTGIVYHDDRQIVCIVAHKRWAGADGPQTKIGVSETI